MLDDEGLTEDTMVIVTTDQGNPYGQRGLWGHPQWTDPPFMHDVTFRVPLIVRQPGTIPPQRVVDRVVSHYDLFPTILDHLGVTDVAIAGTPGRSFAAALRGETLESWEDAAFFEAETARAIRTPEYLYVKHLDGTGEPELYDLVADPEQWTNVATDPACTIVLGKLDAKTRVVLRPARRCAIRPVERRHRPSNGLAVPAVQTAVRQRLECDDGRRRAVLQPLTAPDRRTGVR